MTVAVDVIVPVSVALHVNGNAPVAANDFARGAEAITPTAFTSVDPIASALDDGMIMNALVAVSEVGDHLHGGVRVHVHGHDHGTDHGHVEVSS
jgi:hypothetical protein